MNAMEYVPEMTRRIAQRFDPLRIILFGSLARGEGGPDSDADLLVVFSEVKNKRQSAVEIRSSLRDLPVCKDIFVTTPEEILIRGNLVGDILYDALNEGKVIYERSSH
ncbi:MAG: nucleotidyltransferase domain-containing protein [Candidatus Sumerlaeota bacterium]|nr:nucleotidyltransferase domain-containing protein [Candidatus Sumerlaeota bacterium]